MFKFLILFFIKLINMFSYRRDAIVFYSFPDVSDNALAMAQYLSTLKKRYNLHFIVNDVGMSRETLNKEPWDTSSIILLKNNLYNRIKISLRAKICFDTHYAPIYKFNLSVYPIHVSLWHGSPIKKLAIEKKNGFKYKVDYFVSAHDFFIPFFKQDILDENIKIIVSGYPRNDWLTGKLNGRKVEFSQKPYVVWMPTYQKSLSESFGEKMNFKDGDSIDNQISFLDTSILERLDYYLDSIGLNLIIKFHPFDYLNKVKFKLFKNIIIINNDSDLRGSSLYILLRDSEGLISDYSSVIFDYELTNKPIAIDVFSCSLYKRERYFELEQFSLDFYSISDWSSLVGFLNSCKLGGDRKKQYNFNIDIDCGYSNYITRQLFEKKNDYSGKV